jgi:hypothetical protein
VAQAAPVAQGFSPAKRRWLAALKGCAALVFVLGLTGCTTLTGDSATRLVGAVRDGAARLASSRSDTLVLSVTLRSWPRGCPDAYRVEWRADSDRIPGLGVICASGGEGYASIAYRGFVKIVRPLQVTKGKGEAVTIGLRKRTDGTIDVVALQ